MAKFINAQQQILNNIFNANETKSYLIYIELIFYL